MGGGQSTQNESAPEEVVYDGDQPEEQPDHEEHEPEVEDHCAMPPEMQELLDANTYMPGDHAKYPYFLIQLSENEERDFDDQFVSDAVVQYLRSHRVTHIFAQTHGWNTPPDKAIAVPFTEFMGGMQDDCAMPEPSDDFRPIFVAFIWPALPIEFGRTDDALTKAQLLAKNEREQGEDSEIARACDAVERALQNEDPDDDDLKQSMRSLVVESRDDDDDDDDDPDTVVEREREVARQQQSEDEVESRGLNSILTTVMRPVETFVFGRLMKRGQRVGEVMGSIIGKLMKATEDRKKVCLMANSLGAHVLCGLLNKPYQLPYKIHTVFFVQGAITKEWFHPGAKFGHVHEVVAGPVVCSYSERDLILRNMFGWFHGIAIGFAGTPIGQMMRMKPLQAVAEEPYSLDCGAWNNVDGTEFIDEGNAVAGGHGDFKEDETTSLYWAAIKTEIEESAYDLH